MSAAEQQIRIDAPIQTVFGVVTNYTQYPEFLPEMRHVELVTEYEGVRVVRFEIELIMRLSYVLRLEEKSPTRVSWTLQEGKLFSHNTGGWDLAEQGQGVTLATYRIDLGLKGLIPRSVTNKLVGKTLPETLARFRARSEKLRGPGSV